MRQLKCPRCGQSAFSVRQKLAIRPSRQAVCRLCGAGVSVSPVKSALFLVLTGLAVQFGALVAVLVVGHFSSPLGMTFCAILGGALAAVPCLWLYLRYVPLIEKAA